MKLTLMSGCTNMIPAERCIVLVLPSMRDREALLEGGGSFGQVSLLEQHGVDEIECGWTGDLEVEEHETQHEWWVEGECPVCAGRIIVKGTD